MARSSGQPSQMFAHGTIVPSGKQYLGEEKPRAPQAFRLASHFQPSSQGVQRAVQSFLVKQRRRLASAASERQREQPLAKHVFSSQLGDRLLAAHGHFHQPGPRQRLTQVSPCFPQLVARFSRGGTSGRVDKCAVADLSHKPSSDCGGTNVPAAGIRAENVSDVFFDPAQ